MVAVVFDIVAIINVCIYVLCYAFAAKMEGITIVN